MRIGCHLANKQASITCGGLDMLGAQGFSKDGGVWRELTMTLGCQVRFSRMREAQELLVTGVVPFSGSLLCVWDLSATEQ